MTEEEDKIAFEQWLKDHGHHFPGMKKDTLYYVYRSMDEEIKYYNEHYNDYFEESDMEDK